MTDILPCPFCNSINLYEHYHTTHCISCGAQGDREVWNNRITPQPDQSEVIEDLLDKFPLGYMAIGHVTGGGYWLEVYDDLGAVHHYYGETIAEAIKEAEELK